MKKIERFLLPFDRSSIRAPLNDPIYMRLKNVPANPLLRVLKGLVLSIPKIGYEMQTNERVVEIPFIYQNFDLPDGSKVLDFGCCESKVSIELASLGYDVTGVDMNNYTLTHPNFRFRRMNFLTNDFADGQFDAAVAISAVEHCGLAEYGIDEFPDGDRRIVEQLLRVLRPGGKLYITVPFGNACVLRTPCLQRVYDREALMKLLTGFTVAREAYYESKGRSWVPSESSRLESIEIREGDIPKGVACLVCVK